MSDGSGARGRVRDLIQAQTNRNRYLAVILVAASVVNAGLVAVIVGAFAGPAGMLLALAFLLVMIGWSAFRFQAQVKSNFGGQPLSPADAQRVEPIVRRTAAALSLPTPRIFVSDEEALNAWAAGSGDHAVVVYTAGLLERLDDEELEAVTAHELGHIASRDSRICGFAIAVLSWAQVMCNLAILFAGLLWAMGTHFLARVRNEDWVGALLSLIFGIGFYCFAAVIVAFSHAWFFIARLLHLGLVRQREWMADGIAAATTGRPDKLADALRALAEGPTTLAHGGRAVQALCIAGAAPAAAGSGWLDLLQDHPSPVRRMARLNSYMEAGGEAPGSRSAGSVAVVLSAVLVTALAVPVGMGFVGVFLSPTAEYAVPANQAQAPPPVTAAPGGITDGNGHTAASGNGGTQSGQDEEPAGSSSPTGTEAADGDLGLGVPISSPACDSTWLVFVGAATDAATYAADISVLLNSYPGSAYTLTRGGCSSMRQQLPDGSLIYAVHLGPFPDQATACSVRGGIGGGAYVKRMDNVTPPEQLWEC